MSRGLRKKGQLDRVVFEQFLERRVQDLQVPGTDGWQNVHDRGRETSQEAIDSALQYLMM